MWLLCFQEKVYKLIEWDEPLYGVETQIAVKVGKNKLPFKEVNIDTIYIDKYKGLSIFEAFSFMKLPIGISKMTIVGVQIIVVLSVC